LAKLKELFKVGNPKTFFYIGSLTYKVSNIEFVFPHKIDENHGLGKKKGFYFSFLLNFWVENWIALMDEKILQQM
jgi:hypothetical protein